MAEFEFVVAAHDLDASGKHYRFSVRGPWLRGALEETGVQPAGPDGEIDVRLSKSGTDVVLRGMLTAELCVPCARCLQPARVRVHEPLSALFVPAASMLEGTDGDGAGLTLDDADVNAYDGESVVLDPLIRDELLLSIPMIPLCSENCPGISPEPSLEPPAPASGIDPRLRPLLRLKKSLT